MNVKSKLIYGFFVIVNPTFKKVINQCDSSLWLRLTKVDMC